MSPHQGGLGYIQMDLILDFRIWNLDCGLQWFEFVQVQDDTLAVQDRTLFISPWRWEKQSLAFNIRCFGTNEWV
jgi:hypothetical protein